jgi:hypothetical protein
MLLFVTGLLVACAHESLCWCRRCKRKPEKKEEEEKEERGRRERERERERESEQEQTSPAQPSQQV